MNYFFKLENGMPEHPKIAALDAAAFRAYVCSIAYANRNLTDGFVPDPIAFHLADDPAQGEPRQVMGELVDAGLWQPAAGGYRIHDYLEYQRSRTDVLGISKVRAEAGAKGGKASSRAKTKQTGKQTISKTQAELELEREKTARARKEKQKPSNELRPAAGAYQPFPHEPTPARDTEAGVAAIRGFLTRP